jgi:toxin-antitoxin system PIN domain toxin
VILADVNVLLYAFRDDSPNHAEYRSWLMQLVNGNEPFGVSPLALSGVVRIATNRRIYPAPEPLERALGFCDQIMNSPGAVVMREGRWHWEIFTELCRKVEAKGNLIPDAYFAALAIEHGCEWISADRDYARFPGLRWRHPLG